VLQFATRCPTPIGSWTNTGAAICNSRHDLTAWPFLGDYPTKASIQSPGAPPLSPCQDGVGQRSGGSGPSRSGSNGLGAVLVPPIATGGPVDVTVSPCEDVSMSVQVLQIRAFASSNAILGCPIVPHAKQAGATAPSLVIAQCRFCETWSLDSRGLLG
jgi:hypothetical protein